MIDDDKYFDEDERFMTDTANILDNEDVHCFYCKHFHGEVKETCNAFPDGIPTEIFLGGTRHDKRFDDDNGIMFEKAENGE